MITCQWSLLFLSSNIDSSRELGIHLIVTTTLWQSSSLALDDSSRATTLQGKSIKNFVSIRELNFQGHYVAFDCTGVGRGTAVRLLVNSDMSAMLSIMSAAQAEMRLAINCERPVYRAIRTIIIDRGRAWPNLDSDV